MSLVDTDILVDLLREHPPAIEWLARQEMLPLMTGFSAMELWTGCANGAETRAVDRLVKRFPLVWPTETDQERAMNGFAARRLSHHLGIIDAFIGECAFGRGLILFTFNDKHFRAIPGLKTERPYAR